LTPVVIDTDPGIDDALALLLAARSPELSIEAVTVVGGNVGLDACVRNTLLTLEQSGMEKIPPVAAGCARPLQREPLDAAHVHGDDGLGGVAHEFPAPRTQALQADAVDVLLDAIERKPNELVLVTLGPLTNLATAFRRDPETVRRLKRVVAMGGALRVAGNVTKTAEYNLYADPEAAQAVVAAGLTLTLVGLDVTHRTVLHEDEFARRASRSAQPGAQFAQRVCGHLFGFGEVRRGLAAAYLHDPLAVGAAADPSIVQCERVRVRVETGEPRGALVEAADGDPVDVAVGVEADCFVATFLDRVLGPET